VKKGGREITKEETIICIMCPIGCLITVTIDDNGDILRISGNLCKEGEKYAKAECTFAGRILTTTILTQDSLCKLLPVKTNQPISKEQLMDAMVFISKLKVKPPVKVGQIIVKNLMDMQVDLVATDELPM
jgi:CxxC motif-containing protein